MRKSTITGILLLLQVVVFVSFGYAANNVKKISKTKPLSVKKQEPNIEEKKSPNYLTTTFDLNTDKISTDFMGHDIEQVYKAYNNKAKATQKDEFETTAQFQARLAIQESAPIFGSVGPEAVLAFVVSPTLQYDADKQTLTAYLGTSGVRESSRLDKNRLALKVKPGETSSAKKMGQNAYGAQVEIAEIYTKSFELAIGNTGKTVFMHEMKMEPLDAKLLKDKVAALVLAKAISPFITNGFVVTEATFNNPKGFLGQIYYVNGELLDIWLYDKETGKIIGKISDKSQAVGQFQNIMK